MAMDSIRGRGSARAAALALLLPLAAAGLAASSAAAQEKVIRISTPAVPGDWHAEMLFVFKEWLERSAPGEFDVQVYLSSSLLQQGTEPAAMQRGNLEMALISAQDIAQQIPRYSIFTAGYLIRDTDHQQKVFKGEIGHEFYQAVAEEMEIQILDVAYLGTRQLNLRSSREVSTPADLAGINLRMPGADTWLFLGEALGANPTPLAFGELYTALQTGAVDGQDNPLPTVYAAKFYEVTDQLVLTSHLVDGVFIAIAKSFFDDLTPSQQAKVQGAAAAAVHFNNANRLMQEQELIEYFEEQGLEVTVPDVEAFRDVVQQAYLQSDYSKDWPDGLLERINAVE